MYETTRSDVDDGVAAVDMAATEDSTAGKGINEVMTRAALMKEAGSNTPSRSSASTTYPPLISFWRARAPRTI